MRDHTQFYAKQRSYSATTNGDGTEHADAIWIPGNFYSDPINRSLSFTIDCWHDADAFDAEMHPVAGAGRSYGIGPDGWQTAVTALSPDPPQELGRVLAEFQWNVAILQDADFWSTATDI